jgi:hypothetical protein
MSDATLEAKITADFSDFTAQFQSGGAAMDEFASHASSLEQAYQSISSDALQAEANQETLTNALMGSSSAAEEASSSFGSIAGAMAAGVFGGFELGAVVDKLKDAFKEMTTGTFEWGEGLENLSISTGLSTDQLQTLQYAATVTGVNLDRLQMVVNRVDKAMLDFSQGNSDVTKAADLLHIDPSTWTDAYDAMTKLGDKVKEIGTLSQQQEAALQEFIGGRAGMQALPALEILKQAEQEARDAGIIKSREQIEADDQAAEAIHRVEAGVGSLWHDMGGFLSESILGWGQLVEKMGEASGEAAIAGSFASVAVPQAQQARAAMTTPMSAHAPGAHESKEAFQQEIADQKAAFADELAGAGDTAAAREHEQAELVDYLKGKEFEAALYSIDLSKEISTAKVAEAAAAKSAASEEASAENEAGEMIMANLRRTWNEHYELVEQAHRQEEELARATAEGEEQVDAAKFNLTRAQLAQELEQHKITKAQETQDLIAAENAEYAAKMQALDQELLMLDAGTAAFARAMAQRQALEIQHQTQQTQTETTGDKGNPLGQLGTSVTGQAEAAFTSLTTKAQTAQQFLHNIFTEITNDFIHLVVSMVTESTAFTAIETGLKTMFASVAPAASAALAASGVTTQALVLQKAGEAAASQFANVIATVPFPENLALAPGMAAAAFAQTEAYGVVGTADRGAYLSQDMPIFAHAREMVLPADISDKVLSGAGGGDTHNYNINLSHTIHAMDASSFEDFAGEHYDAIMKSVERGIRNAHPAAQAIARSHR